MIRFARCASRPVSCSCCVQACRHSRCSSHVWQRVNMLLKRSSYPPIKGSSCHASLTGKTLYQKEPSASPKFYTRVSARTTFCCQNATTCRNGCPCSMPPSPIESWSTALHQPPLLTTKQTSPEESCTPTPTTTHQLTETTPHATPLSHSPPLSHSFSSASASPRPLMPPLYPPISSFKHPITLHHTPCRDKPTHYTCPATLCSPSSLCALAAWKNCTLLPTHKAFSDRCAKVLPSSWRMRMWTGECVRQKNRVPCLFYSI